MDDDESSDEWMDEKWIVTRHVPTNFPLKRKRQTDEERKEKRRKYDAERRARETEDQRNKRLETNRNRAREKRATQTKEQKEQINEQERVAAASHRAAETPEQHEQRCEIMRVVAAARIAAETPEQCVQRTNTMRKSAAEQRATPQSREKNRQQQQSIRDKRKTAPTSLYIARNPDKTVEVYSVGRLDVVCISCGAKHFVGELTAKKTFSLCCNSGNIAIAPLSIYPAEFKSWLSGEDSEAKHFRQSIRQYNCAFAFVSFGYKLVEQKWTGPLTFVIHGQVYHKISEFASIEGSETPTYSQLYFLDPDSANESRINNEHNSECRMKFMEDIEQVLTRLNPYIHAYKMMKQVVKDTGSTDVEMRLVKHPQYDPRRYNLPIATNEVAAIFTSGEDNEEDFQREICIHPKGNNESLKYLRITDPNLDPMTYPILFPSGDEGWTYKTGDSEKKISMCDYYCYRLQDRTQFNPLLHSSKLTQMYVVDAFLKIEGDRLHWIRKEQAKLRVESYQGLMDFVTQKADKEGLKPGKLFILPSSFTGGKRQYQQSFQDAMAMVAENGKPDLFITFTCNPKWAEITESILPHETSIDRPDVVARVFHLKLKQFLDDMNKGKALGNVKCYQSVIEFQKRGLPHCHMLFILEDNDKLREPEDVDRVVCAEIPDSVEDPILYNIISTSMMHGPCGKLNPSSPCMEKNDNNELVCKKKFPKDFCPATVINSNGYPEYRRRNDGRAVTTKSGKLLSNQWVVPYNKYFCKKFNAHINVEICSSIKSVKYIYKYIYKGHDAALVRVDQKTGERYLDRDEISVYMDTRYLSAPEAMWRINKFSMEQMSHTVIRLAVHLPDEQTIKFRTDDSEDFDVGQALQQARERKTTLLAWFKLNEEYADARQYLYREIPHHFTFSKGMYKPRKRGSEKVISRMYTVSPKETERYALRLLLLHVKGATCYEDLKTVDEETYHTFAEAALKHGLLEDDKCWITTMADAVTYQMPSQLRMVFGYICVIGCPSQPIALFEQFKADLIEDYLYQYEDVELALNYCLLDLEDFFSTHKEASCLKYCGQSPTNFVDVRDLTLNVQAEEDEGLRLKAMLNEEQLDAFNQIMAAIDGESSEKCFFLSGAGGCGKTFLYRAITCTLLGRRQRVKSVAPTGLAATLLKNGQTIHSGFGLPFDITAESISSIKQGSKAWKLLKETKLIIWDKISMSTRLIAPVIKHANRLKIIESCVKKSSIWKCFKEITLTANMRVNKDEIEFSKWLLAVGAGKSLDGKRSDYVSIPTNVLSNDIVKDVYGEDIAKLSREEIASRAILCPLNEDTLKLNERILNTLPGKTVTYYSIDTIKDCETEGEESIVPVEYLNSLVPMGMPPYKLNLKAGCCVMLLRNLNPKQGLCNGTRLIVEKMSHNILQCSILIGDRKGSCVLIPRLCLDTKDADVPFKFSRKQFPIRLAYSMTITKSQGQTFDKIGVYLPKPVFAHGQFYTALSRVKSNGGLFIEIGEGATQGQIFENDESTYAYNYVFDELL